MSTTTGIQWTDATWNPIRGCTRVSEGCRNCYAEAVAARFSGPGQPYEGLARRRSNGEPAWTGDVRVIESHLCDPLRWRTPRRVFVNSMSDLFHERVSDTDLLRIFTIMGQAITWCGPRHTYQILTKRPERMRDFMGQLRWQFGGPFRMEVTGDRPLNPVASLRTGDPTPAPHIWLGVSVEDQRAADERIPLLLDTPAAVRFLSCEPLLGPVDLSAPFTFNRFPGGPAQAPRIELLDWVIVGGESGRNARPMDVRWAAQLVQDCQAAGVPVFVKQLGAVPMEPEDDWRGRATTRLLNARNRDRVPAGFVPLAIGGSHGDQIDTFPAELRVREWPGQDTGGAR